MKVTRILLLLSVAILLGTMDMYAQMGGMGGMNSRGGMGRSSTSNRGAMSSPGTRSAPKQVEVDPLESAGYFLFSADDVVEECKIKKEDKISMVSRYLSVYLIEYDKISFDYALQIDSLANAPKLEGQNLSEEQMQDFRRYSNIYINLKKRTGPMHAALNKNMTSLFDEKEVKRWNSYYKNLCKEKFYVGIDDIHEGRGPGPGPGPGPGDRSEEEGGEEPPQEE